jgi:hypothetical protein
VTHQDESIGVLLLGAVRAVFAEREADRLVTLELLRGLVEREGEPWGGWWGKAVDQAQDGETPRKPAQELARYLKRFEVEPKQMWIEDRNVRGYDLVHFTDAFERFLPICEPPNARALERLGDKGLSTSIASESDPRTLARKPLEEKGSSLLAFGRPYVGEKEGHGDASATGSFASSRAQQCLRCNGTRWWHDGPAGDRCLTCDPPPGTLQGEADRHGTDDDAE